MRLFHVQTFIYLCEAMLQRAISPESWKAIQSLIRLTDQGGAQSEEALTERDSAESEAALRRCAELDPDETTAIDAWTHIGILRRDAGDLAADDRPLLWQLTSHVNRRDPQLGF